MTYSELLLTDEWKNRRIEIISRDENRCQKCLNLKTIKDLRSGIIDKPAKEYFGNILVWQSGNQSVLKISKHEFSLLQNESFIVFQEVDAWCRIIGIKHMPANERRLYLTKRNQLITEAIATSICFGINVGDTLKQEENTTYHSKNLNNLIVETLTEIVDNKSLKWLFFKGLHVHHKYYQLEKLPWQYPDEALVTLCWSCHEALHREEKVPCLDENGNQISLLTPCSRCYGAGWFPEYNHVQNGVCFECNGAKYEELF